MTPRFHLGRLEVKKWLPHGQPSSKVNFEPCGETVLVEQSWWNSNSGTVMVEQYKWNSNGEKVIVEQSWSNSHGGTVMVEQ